MLLIVPSGRQIFMHVLWIQFATTKLQDHRWCLERQPNPPLTALSRGVARILGKGVLEYAREARAQKFKPRPLINRQGRSSNCQREHVLNVASELAQGFRPDIGIR